MVSALYSRTAYFLNCLQYFILVVHFTRFMPSIFFSFMFIKNLLHKFENYCLLALSIDFIHVLHKRAIQK